MPQLFETPIGRKYYDHTMPRIADQLTRLNNLLEMFADGIWVTERNPDTSGHVGFERSVTHFRPGPRKEKT
jgi:hypothetical protein